MLIDRIKYRLSGLFGEDARAIIPRLLANEGRRYASRYALAFVFMFLVAASTSLSAYLMKDVVNPPLRDDADGAEPPGHRLAFDRHRHGRGCDCGRAGAPPPKSSAPSPNALRPVPPPSRLSSSTSSPRNFCRTISVE